MSFIPPTRHIRRVKKLYKTILRLHSHLPEEMQTLGTTYARDEFRRHKKCTSHEANVFMSEWTVSIIYLYCNYSLTQKYKTLARQQIVIISASF